MTATRVGSGDRRGAPGEDARDRRLRRHRARASRESPSLGYGMHVVGCSRPGVPPPAALEHFDVVTNDFAIAVREADFVSLHMTASRENVHFINRERLAHLGERTWLINTARGSIVDEGALFEALSHRRLAGAALDVFEREPYAPAERRRRSSLAAERHPDAARRQQHGRSQPPHGRARAPEHRARRSPRVRADGSGQSRGFEFEIM